MPHSKKGVIMEKGIYAGSFDPPTNAHFWIIEEATKAFNLHILIANNPKKQSLLPNDVKVSLIENHLKQNKLNAHVSVLPNIFVGEYAMDNNIKYFIRGIRNNTDLEYEQDMVSFNYDYELTTICFLPPGDLVNISSSAVKNIIGVYNWRSAILDYVCATQPCTAVSDAIEEQYYKNRFTKLLQRCVLPEYLMSDDLFDQEYKAIKSAYSQTHRQYHTIAHIKSCLNEFELIKDRLQEPDIVELALWYHDFVYNPKSQTNEYDSATHLRIAGYLDTHIQKLVCSYIGYTNHKHEVPLNDVQYLLDIDMSGLALVPPECYEQEIAAEYIPVFGQKKYRAGRIKFLKSLLAKKHIYKTEFFRNKYETIARENIKQNLKTLKPKAKRINS